MVDGDLANGNHSFREKMGEYNLVNESLRNLNSISEIFRYERFRVHLVLHLICSSVLNKTLLYLHLL